MWVAFANAKATHIFFSKNISIYATFNDQSFNDQSFNDTLTNDTVSFEQLGPGGGMLEFYGPDNTATVMPIRWVNLLTEGTFYHNAAQL